MSATATRTEQAVDSLSMGRGLLGEQLRPKCGQAVRQCPEPDFIHNRTQPRVHDIHSRPSAENPRQAAFGRLFQQTWPAYKQQQQQDLKKC